MLRLQATILAAATAVALIMVPNSAASTNMGPRGETVGSLIVRYAPGVNPGAVSSPTGAKRVPQPQRAMLRLGEPLGSGMYTIRLTRGVSAQVAREICRQLAKDRRVLWAEPDAKASVARPSGVR